LRSLAGLSAYAGLDDRTSSSMIVPPSCSPGALGAAENRMPLSGDQVLFETGPVAAESGFGIVGLAGCGLGGARGLSERA